MRLKSTSKEKQKKYIEHLEGLFDDLPAIIPECLDGGMFCNFNAYRKKLESLQNSQSFDKYSKAADQILSGLSETRRIMELETDIVFGMLKTPFGSIEYAKRGTTDDSVLAGLQHYDNPLWRMLTFSSLAKTKGVRVYSSSSFFIGSCKNSSPGVDFFKSVLEDENIPFEEKDGDLEIPGQGHSMEILHLGTVKFRFFENSSYNLVGAIMKHIMTPDIGTDFSFKSDYLEDIIPEISPAAISGYMSGTMSDRAFLKEVKKYRESEAMRKGYYIVGDRGYTSPEDFVGDNSFSYVPDNIVIDALNTYGKGIKMETFSERKVLEAVWPESRIEILEALYPDVDPSTFKSMKGSPVDQIESIRENSRIEEIKSGIEIEAWSPDSQYLVDIINSYFTMGKNRALRDAEKGMGNSNAKKAVFYAFLDCIGETKNREWQFTDTERDLSLKIKPHLSRILEEGSEVINEEMEKIRVYIR